MIKPIKISSINCMVDERYELLYEYFMSSIRDASIPIIKHKITIKHDAESNNSYEGMLPWSTNQFKFAMKTKIEKIIDSLKTENGSVIWTDIDIFFLKPISHICEDLSKIINFCDLAISPEWTANVNTGFLIARCNKSSISFFEKLLATMTEKNETEQPLTNNMLGTRERHGIEKFQIRWRRLSEKYWNMTLNTPLDDSSMFIHANWPGGFNRHSNEELVGDYVQKKKQMIDFFLGKIR